MNGDQQQSSIYDNLAQLGTHLTEMEGELAELQTQLNQALAQNAELRIENQHLQTAIKKLRDKQGDPPLSTGRRTLNELYQQGFHVCRKHFGERLAPHEGCIFCDEAIFSGMDNKKGRQNATN